MDLPNRRSIRLAGYDYAQEGLYFVTICTHDMRHWFGHIADDLMCLNEFGQLANNQWDELPQRFPNIALDVFQIMPNHMHGILEITAPGSVPVNDMVRAYKSLVALDCLDLFKRQQPGVYMGKFWQRDYYEHIIRTEKAYANIADYIVNNPANWSSDKFHGL